jgi:hypothetical protein
MMTPSAALSGRSVRAETSTERHDPVLVQVAEVERVGDSRVAKGAAQRLPALLVVVRVDALERRGAQDLVRRVPQHPL